MKRAPKFEVYHAADGWRWRLNAANGETLASGEGYTRKAGALRGVEAFKRAAAAAATVDLTSKAMTH